TVDTFFGRVTKVRIVDAVREARGDAQAQLIAHLKKGDMAAQAEQLLAGSGWLPEPLRTPGQGLSGSVERSGASVEASIAQSAASEGETAIDPTADEPATADR